MNTGIALADIASRTLLWLAGIGALVKLAPPVLARTGVSNTKSRQQSPDNAAEVPVSVTGGPSHGEGGA